MSTIPPTTEQRPPAGPCEPGYWTQANRALDELGEKLANIRNDADNGDITIREAADERVQVLSDHLARLIELRRQFFGGI